MAKKKSFEDNLENLNLIVEKLEDNSISLDEALKSFEEGIKLYRKCNEILEKAESKISILIEENENYVEKEFEEITDDR